MYFAPKWVNIELDDHNKGYCSSILYPKFFPYTSSGADVKFCEILPKTMQLYRNLIPTLKNFMPKVLCIKN